MKISTILDHIDSGHLALPAFQRGYVWNRDQVRGFFQSLYKRHPVDGLLVWAAESKTAESMASGRTGPAPSAASDPSAAPAPSAAPDPSAAPPGTNNDDGRPAGRAKQEKQEKTMRGSKNTAAEGPTPPDAADKAGRVRRLLDLIRKNGRERSDGKWLEDPALLGEAAQMLPVWGLRKIQSYSEWARDQDRSVRDLGIDLVGIRHDGELAALQCKARKEGGAKPQIAKSQIDSFANAAADREWAERRIICNRDASLAPNAMLQARDTGRPIRITNLRADLEERLAALDQGLVPAVVQAPQTRGGMQEEAASAAIRHLQADSDGGRCRIVLPDGAGKTVIALKIIESLIGRGGMAVVLRASIDAADHARRAFINHARGRLRTLAVVPPHAEGDATIAPTAGDADAAADWLRRRDRELPNIVFAAAEAARTLEDSFQQTGIMVRALAADEIAIDAMGRDPAEAFHAEHTVYLASPGRAMDDEIAAPTVYRRSFRDAVLNGWLPDYRIQPLADGDMVAYGRDGAALAILTRRGGERPLRRVSLDRFPKDEDAPALRDAILGRGRQDAETAGERLKAARERREMDDNELARLSGVGVRRIRSIESGADNILLDEAAAMAAVMDVSLEHIAGAAANARGGGDRPPAGGGFRERLQQARKRSGMSQSKLSIQCGRGRDWVHYLEAGDKAPDRDGLETLAAELKTTVEDLTGDMCAAQSPRGRLRDGAESDGEAETFGERLRRLREERGMQQKDVGDAADMAGGQIAAYETRSRIPRPKTMKRLARALGVTADELASGAGAAAPPRPAPPNTAPDGSAPDPGVDAGGRGVKNPWSA